jgi:hypothetical protein
MKSIKSTFPYLLAILCIIGGGYHLYQEFISLNSEDLSHDMVSSWDQHMKLIREYLPPDVFIVGYLEARDIFPSSKYDDAELFLTQYGIAPVAMIKGYEFEWIIGNFGNNISLQSIKSWLDQRVGEYTIQDLGFGIYLIHRIGN